MNTRIIARLDVKAPFLIKGINLEGVRKIGNPHDFAADYYQNGIDEIIYMDAVASLYGRNGLADLVSETAADVFVPMTVGGGIRTIDDVGEMMKAGADKIAMNTAAINKPEEIQTVARKFGGQAVVLSIEAKARDGGGWEAYVDNGREKTGRDVIEWAQEAVELGASEIMLTSVDHEGTTEGFNIPLVEAVSNAVNVPIIASGGAGTLDHISEVILETGVSAVALAHVLHYKKLSIHDVKEHLSKKGVSVRNDKNLYR